MTTNFTYPIYIQTTPEQVWQSLTNPDLMKRYWWYHQAGEKTFRSDWRKGSTYEMAHEEVGLVVSDPEQVILESDPYYRLAYTWHTITPEWAVAVGMDEATADVWRAEPRSKVAFAIEDVGHGAVRLTVVHDGFESGSAVLQGISEGWPAVLPSLKTLLETGSTLRTSKGAGSDCHTGPASCHTPLAGFADALAAQYGRLLCTPHPDRSPTPIRLNCPTYRPMALAMFRSTIWCVRSGKSLKPFWLPAPS
jgi:uncharacterized protein YndB with AHSA1/START domain